MKNKFLLSAAFLAFSADPLLARYSSYEELYQAEIEEIKKAVAPKATSLTQPRYSYEELYQAEIEEIKKAVAPKATSYPLPTSRAPTLEAEGAQADLDTDTLKYAAEYRHKADTNASQLDRLQANASATNATATDAQTVTVINNTQPRGNLLNSFYFFFKTLYAAADTNETNAAADANQTNATATDVNETNAAANANQTNATATDVNETNAAATDANETKVVEADTNETKAAEAEADAKAKALVKANARDAKASDQIKN